MIDAPELAKEEGAAVGTLDRRNGFRGYLLSLSAGLILAVALFWLALFALDRTENLPPPAFSNSICLDEKLSFLRDNPIESPNLLVIGSSVAWRHVDGNAFVNAIPGARPMNGAFCGLFANQSIYVGNWLLDRMPDVRHVVMIADPQDFGGCWRVPDAVFDRSDVSAYVYDRASPWGYYMRYFSPRSLARNALDIKAKRAGLIEWDLLVFNRYGDGPLPTARSRELLYGKPEALDRNCFAALSALGERLEAEGRQFTMVSTPLHPEWKQLYDPDGSFLADFDQRIQDSLGATGTYWNADKDWQPPENAFVDAVHMRWSAAQAFSGALAEQLSSANVTGKQQIGAWKPPPVDRHLMTGDGK